MYRFSCRVPHLVDYSSDEEEVDAVHGEPLASPR